MTIELQAVLLLAKELSPDQIPRLLGDLEEIRATAMMRLSAPGPEPQADHLLDIEAAATRLGMSTKYLYRHSAKFPFTRHEGRNLRFSSLGIDTYIKKGRR